MPNGWEWQASRNGANSTCSGHSAATLYVASADGTLENVINRVNSQPASSITMTIDDDLQQQAQAAMDGLPGAIVVMEIEHRPGAGDGLQPRL